METGIDAVGLDAGDSQEEVRIDDAVGCSGSGGLVAGDGELDDVLAPTEAMSCCGVPGR